MNTHEQGTGLIEAAVLLAMVVIVGVLMYAWMTALAAGGNEVAGWLVQMADTIIGMVGNGAETGELF